MEDLPTIETEIYRTKYSSLSVEGKGDCVNIEFMREMYRGYKKLGDMVVNNFETLEDALFIMKDDPNFENFKSYVTCEIIGRNKKNRFDLLIKYEGKVTTNGEAKFDLA
jgi:hypothetical protein